MNLTLTTTLHEQVTPEFLHAFNVALTALETAAAFAVSLTTADRLRMRGFGASNESFVPDVIEATTVHADLVPARCGAAQIAARRTATVELIHLATRVEELRQRLHDTARVTGDGCVGLTLDAYQTLKRVAQSEGIEATVDRMARRFANVAAAARGRAANAGADAPSSGSAAPAASPAPSGGSAPNVVSLPASASPLTQAA